MIPATVYFLIKTILLLFVTLTLLIIVITITIKLILEPVKGVCKSKARLDGKVALVTGGNAGIGLETARDLAGRGARVVIVSRDAKRSAEAVAEIVSTTGNKNVEYKCLDLARFSSVREFAADFNESYDRLDLLVHNAGCAIYNPKPTEDGLGLVMQVNYLGPFLLTNLLMDKLIASKTSRIAIVSSCVHFFGRINAEDLKGLKDQGYFRLFITYSTSKLCHMLWAKALLKRLPAGVTVNVLHPGVVSTDFFKDLPLLKLLYLIINMVFKNPKEGAQTTIHVCVDESLNEVTGKYFMECKEAAYSKFADNEELVEKVWNRCVDLTSHGQNE